jgi:hypothetical protein
MQTWMWVALAAFIIVDVVVTVAVLKGVLAVDSSLKVLTAMPDRKIVEAAHELVGQYLKANYSGDPNSLPAALNGVVPQVTELIRESGAEPGPDVVKALIAISAAKHRVGTMNQIREALKAAA